MALAVKIPIQAIDKATATISGVQKKLGTFSSSAQRQISRVNASSRRLSSTLTSIGGALAAAVSIRAVGAGVASIVRTGAQFEATMDSTIAKFGGVAKVGTEASQALGDTAKEIGKVTEFKASDAAQGLEFLAMAGISAADSIKILPTIVDAATVAGGDLARATDIITDTLGGYSLAADEASRVNDVLAKTITTANTDMEGLFESTKSVAPVATAMGYSIETTSTLIGALANAGIKGSQAGVNLRASLTRLSAPTAAASEALKKLGVSTTNSDGEFRDIIEIIGDLDTAMTDLSPEEKAKYMKDIFETRNLAAMNILLNKGENGLNAYRSELESSDGAASSMAAAMRDNLQGSFRSLGSAAESVGLALYETFKGNLKGVVDTITDITRNISAWVTENKEIIAQRLDQVFSVIGTAAKIVLEIIQGIWQAFTVMRPVLIPIIAAFIAYKTAMTIMTIATAAQSAAQAILNGVMLANPVGLIIAGLAALIAIIVLVVKNLDFVKAAFETVWDGIKATFFTVIDVIIGTALGFVQNLLGIIGSIGKAIGLEMTGIQNAMATIGGIRDNIRSQSLASAEGREGLTARAEQRFDTVRFDRAEEIRLAKNNTQNGAIDINFNDAPSTTRVAARGSGIGNVSFNAGAQ